MEFQSGNNCPIVFTLQHVFSHLILYLHRLHVVIKLDYHCCLRDGKTGQSPVAWPGLKPGSPALEFPALSYDMRWVF